LQRAAQNFPKYNYYNTSIVLEWVIQVIQNKEMSNPAGVSPGQCRVQWKKSYARTKLQKWFKSFSKSSLGTSAIWPIVFLIGFVPGALMNVVQERASKGKRNLDYLHLLAWVSVYQVITDICSFWVNFAVPDTDITNFRDFGGMLDDGFGCFFGRDIMVNGTIRGNCKMAAVDTSLFVAGYVGTYAFTALILKMASSIFFILSNAPVAPATAIIFFIVGMDHLTWFNGVALPIMLIGVVIQLVSDFLSSKQEIIDKVEHAEQQHQ